MVIFAALATTAVSAQTTRRATDIASLVAFPGFYHGQAIVLHAELVEMGSTIALVQPDESRALRVTSQTPVTARGRVEVRGVFWDVGRLKPDDPRVAASNIQGLVGPSAENDWPKPGELFALSLSDAFPVATSSSSALRDVVLETEKFVDKPVTLVGQFRGRNLYGDLPQAPGVSRWDFVLKSADAAVWVTGTQPKGKGFDLNLTARIDTGRWLQVSGLVKRGNGLVWIDSAKIALTDVPATVPVEETVPQKGPAPVVVFTTPTDSETGVPLDTRVRIQFSRDMDPQSFRQQVRVQYAAPPSSGQSDASTTPPAFTSSYDAATRALTIQFSEPLARFRTVVIEVLDGVKAFDGVGLVPFTLSFSLSG